MPPATSARQRFTEALGDRPVLGMLHLKGSDAGDRLARALREFDLLAEGGVDAVVVEDYYGDPGDVERVLTVLAERSPRLPYGVNVLDDGARSFDLADEYGARFVQMDSVAGHLTPEDDAPFAAWLDERRRRSAAVLLGGVRFKYQPVLSGNSLETDLALATGRCDAVVVTGDATGEQTDPAKIAEFRTLLGADFPLVVGAGVTVDNYAAQLDCADGAIVGSFLKDNHIAAEEMNAEHVATMVAVAAHQRLSSAPGGSRAG